MTTTDWLDWHRAYQDPASDLSARLEIVQGWIAAFLDSTVGQPTRVISMCAGTGRDLLPLLAAHPAARRMTGRLVELDPSLAQEARRYATANGIAGIHIDEADAGMTDAYVGSVPADLVLVCGVFGNIPDADVQRTIGSLRHMCAHGATVIWTRHRRAPDLTPSIRGWFSAAGFEERGLSSPGPDAFAVGVHEYQDVPEPLEPGRRMFTFVV